MTKNMAASAAFDDSNPYLMAGGGMPENKLIDLETRRATAPAYDIEVDTTGEHNDARVLGEEPDTLAAFLERPATLMTGAMWGQHDRRNTQDGDWKPTTMTWGQWIEGQDGQPAWGFSRHPVSKNKAGACVVLGESVGGARKAKAMTVMHAMGLDIDGGAKMDDVIAAIRRLDLLALIYTTHSHGKSGLELDRDLVMRKLGLTDAPTLDQIRGYLREHHKDRLEESFIEAVAIADASKHTAKGIMIALDTPPIDKFRIIFPLETPVTITELAATHEDALKVWENKITGMARHMLGVHFDVSAMDCSRLFYTARHPKDAAEWDCLILQGAPLQFADVPEMEKSEYTRARSGDSEPAKRFHTESGVDLNDWYNANAENFQVAEFLETVCPDKVRGTIAAGVVSECPFEDVHTTAGGTGTIAVNALDANGGRGTIKCQHDSCAGRGNAEYLAEMLDASWFTEDELFDADAGHVLESEEGEAEPDNSESRTPDGDTDSNAFEASKVWLTKRFKISGGTIWAKGDDDETAVPVCAAFDVVGRSSNEDGTAGAGRIISFVNENGKTVERTISRADIAVDGNAVIRDLADTGLLMFGRGKKSTDRLLDLLNEITPQRQIPTVNTPGWVRDEYGDVAGFMHPTGVYNRVSGPPCRLLEGSRVEVVKTKGTQAEWSTAAIEALTYADSNFYWPLGLISGFAGPLLGLLGWLPCGFSLSGQTSKGKTMALIMGTTVWTTPTAGDGVLFTANTTGNAVEDLATRGTDSFLGMDELGAMADKRGLGGILFGLSTGRTKSRKSGRERGLTQADSFRPFAMFSSENGLRNEIIAAGGTYRAGLAVRFPDIDVSEGVTVSQDNLTKLDTFKNNYGHAGPVYIRHLIESGYVADPAKLEKEVLAIASGLAQGKGAAMGRAARVFALAQRGGELAADAALLGDKDAAKAAIRTAVQAAWDTFLDSDEAGAASSGDAMQDAIRAKLNSMWDRTIIEAGVIGSDGSIAGEADGKDARGTPLGWYDHEFIYLDWTQIADPAQALGVSIVRKELVKVLGDAVDWKSDREAPQAKLPAHVATAASGDGRAVKNLKLRRDKLGL